MLFAHIPAGYILTKTLQKKLNVSKYLWIGLLGSMLPDFDMLYFYFVDNKQTLHHAYWFHVPFFWLCLLGIVIIFNTFLKKTSTKLFSIFLFSGVFLHLILDSIIEHGIKWFYPFFDKSVYFVTIPAVYDWWAWSFIFHPSFITEISIITAAGYVFYKENYKKL